MKLNDYLIGTGVALITPFNSKGTIDFPALERLVNNVIELGVDYLVVLGTTAETPVLTTKEKHQVIELVKQVNADRVPVVVGIAGNNTQAMMEDISALPLDRVKALMVASPYYNRPSQEGIYEHYKVIAHASSLPILLYNVPARTGSNINVDTVIRLAEEMNNIIGIKEASGNMNQCMHILERRPLDFLVISGDDHLALAQIALGMDGLISVAANCFPKEISTMIELAMDGDFNEASLFHYKLLKAFDLMFEENNPAGVKAFLAEQGLVENILRLPLVPVREELSEKIKHWVHEYGRYLTLAPKAAQLSN